MADGDGKHILVVDDEPDILEVIRYNLTRQGHRVTCVETGRDGLAVAQNDPPDLVLLDLMLPDLDGIAVCKKLRQDPATQAIPVIMVTAKGADPEVVGGLDAGADDYLVKPFSSTVLVARVAAMLRRTTTEPQATLEDNPTISHHGVSIDPGRHQVTVDGEDVRLTPTEFRILQLLAGRPGWVFSRGQIVDNINDDHTAVTERSVDVQVAGLRKKMGEAGGLVETVRGVGYRFKQ